MFEKHQKRLMTTLEVRSSSRRLATRGVYGEPSHMTGDDSLEPVRLVSEERVVPKLSGPSITSGIFGQLKDTDKLKLPKPGAEADSRFYRVAEGADAAERPVSKLELNETLEKTKE